MNNQCTARIKKNTEETNHNINLSLVDNPAVQNLLDVLVSIIAEEYIDVARQNPDIFSSNGGFK